MPPVDDMFGQVARALDQGDSRLSAFKLLLQLLSRQFDHGGAASALRELQKFRVPERYAVFCYYLS